MSPNYYFQFFFQFKDHLIGKFSNNIEFRKLDFLSEEELIIPIRRSPDLFDDFQLMLLQDLSLKGFTWWIGDIYRWLSRFKQLGG